MSLENLNKDEFLHLLAILRRVRLIVMNIINTIHEYETLFESLLNKGIKVVMVCNKVVILPNPMLTVGKLFLFVALGIDLFP